MEGNFQDPKLGENPPILILERGESCREVSPALIPKVSKALIDTSKPPVALTLKAYLVQI